VALYKKELVDGYCGRNAAKSAEIRHALMAAIFHFAENRSANIESLFLVPCQANTPQAIIAGSTKAKSGLHAAALITAARRN
jgi:hypothetical protein